jgi:BON domain-containing protein
MDNFKPHPAAPAAVAHNGNGNGTGHGNGYADGTAAHPIPAGADGSDASVGRSSGDDDITARVKAALGALPDLISRRVGVDTRDGVVTLTRSVESRAQTEAAISIAAQVAGIKYVNDRLIASAKSLRRKTERRKGAGRNEDGRDG